MPEYTPFYNKTLRSVHVSTHGFYRAGVGHFPLDMFPPGRSPLLVGGTPDVSASWFLQYPDVALLPILMLLHGNRSSAR